MFLAQTKTNKKGCIASGQGGNIYGQMLSGWHGSAAVIQSTINKLIHGGEVTATRWLSSRMKHQGNGQILSQQEGGRGGL